MVCFHAFQGSPPTQIKKQLDLTMSKAPSVEYLPHTYKALGLIPQTAYNPSNW